jgi:hypothetical protein
MKADGVMFSYIKENIKGWSTIVKEVFTMNFKPLNRRPILKYFLVMRMSQAYAYKRV